jgi:hypothetical protein
VSFELLCELGDPAMTKKEVTTPAKDHKEDDAFKKYLDLSGKEPLN